MRTYVYVDGFNLYYGALRGTPHKWLDIDALCKRLLPHDSIELIRYFSAIVSARPDDPSQPDRQFTYLRALATLPNASIHLGSFLPVRKTRPEVGTGRWVTVHDSEEKGSDVNLATYLVHDAHLGRYGQAAIISNDSDLLTPIEIVTRELGLRVVVLNPHKRPSRELLRVAPVRAIRAGPLRDSQFEDELRDTNGTFHKPASW